MLPPRHRPPRSSFCPPQCSWRCRPMCTRQPMWRRHPTNYFREHPQYHRHQQRDQQQCSKRCSWGRHAGGCRKPFDRPNPAAVGRAESRADSAPGFEGAVQTNDWSNITDSHASSAGQPARLWQPATRASIQQASTSSHGNHDTRPGVSRRLTHPVGAPTTVVPGTAPQLGQRGVPAAALPATRGAVSPEATVRPPSPQPATPNAPPSPSPQIVNRRLPQSAVPLSSPPVMNQSPPAPAGANRARFHPR